MKRQKNFKKKKTSNRKTRPEAPRNLLERGAPFKSNEIVPVAIRGFSLLATAFPPQTISSLQVCSFVQNLSLFEIYYLFSQFFAKRTGIIIWVFDDSVVYGIIDENGDRLFAKLREILSVKWELGDVLSHSELIQYVSFSFFPHLLIDLFYRLLKILVDVLRCLIEVPIIDA
ncbi:hypothetical protein QYF36_018050 [Acer negundo]|nr:hypothetical protein QYF36_018050 [Acer negundo]